MSNGACAWHILSSFAELFSLKDFYISLYKGKCCIIYFEPGSLHFTDKILKMYIHIWYATVYKI